MCWNADDAADGVTTDDAFGASVVTTDTGTENGFGRSGFHVFCMNLNSGCVSLVLRNSEFGVSSRLIGVPRMVFLLASVFFAPNGGGFGAVGLGSVLTTWNPSGVVVTFNSSIFAKLDASLQPAFVVVGLLHWHVLHYPSSNSYSNFVRSYSILIVIDRVLDVR